MHIKISTKIFTTLLISSLSLLLLASIIFYTSEKKTLQNQIYNQLQSIASLQHARLDSIVKQNLERLKLVASRTQLRISFEKYLKGESRDQHQGKMVRILGDAKSSIKSFRDIHILSQEGIVVASTAKRDLAGTIHFDKSILDRAHLQNSADTLYLDANGELLILLAGPLYLNGDLLGAIIIESEVKNLISSISNYTGLGKTGEIIVARKTENGDALFLFPTRFDPKASLRRNISKKDINCPLIMGISQQSDIISTGDDYRAQTVLAVSKYLNLVDWTILVKVDEAEAFIAIGQAKKLITIVTIGLIFLSILIAFILSRGITRPIVYLTDITRKITKDGLQTRIEKTSNDEIGDLANSFSEMIKTRHAVEEEREKLVLELQNALAEVQVLRSILPICSYCKKIRNDEGCFEQMESYLHKYSGIDFSHTICISCMKKHHPEEYKSISNEKK